MTLLASSMDSRDTRSKRPPRPTLAARQANNSSEPPVTTARKIRMKMPRLGSVAKAWTEVRTPERTRKVPNNDKKNTKKTNNTNQNKKHPHNTETTSKRISAV